MAPTAQAKTAVNTDQVFFDMAEAVENGSWRGLVSTTAQGPSLESTVEERQFTVISNKELGWYKLVNAAGETLLISKPVDEGRRFNIYVSRTGQNPKAPKPLFSRAFALVANSRNTREWILTSLFCEKCEARGRRTCGHAPLARMRCHADRSGAGRGAVTGMDMELPMLREDGTRTCMCDVCGDASAPWAAELTSRMGSAASAKSFLLERTSYSSGDPSLRISKVTDTKTESKSTLEYDAPLSMLQAFAAGIVASK